MAEISDTDLLEVIKDFLEMGHVDNIVAMFYREPRYFEWTGAILDDERFAVRLGVSVLVGVIIYGIAYFFPVLFPALPLLGGVVVLHNAVAFTTGALAGRALSRKPATRRALTFEIGIQNSGLALVILLSQLKGLG